VKIPEIPAYHSKIEIADPTIIEEAQRVHTVRYLEEGYIVPEQLNEDGLFVDDGTSRADYILVKLGDKETALRMIHTDKKHGGLLSLPTLRHFEIDTDILKEVAHVSRLSDIKASSVVEPSGLASISLGDGATKREVFDASRQVYATGLRRSLDQGHTIWVMNIDEDKKKGFDVLLGKGAMVQIGEEAEYMGPSTIPVALNPQDVVKSILLDKGRFGEINRADISNTLNGVSEKYLTGDIIKLLHENNIETKRNSVASKLWRNKKLGFYSLIVGYSAARFLPVGAVEQFHGSVAAYAAIDVGTAFTQIGSMELFLKGKNRAVRAMGILGTAASFAAPYGYFYLNGDEYPAYVNVVAGGFAAIGIGLEADKSIRDHKLRQSLEATDIPHV